VGGSTLRRGLRTPIEEAYVERVDDDEAEFPGVVGVVVVVVGSVAPSRSPMPRLV
jgi:hypothetical protein